ncbi:MULTISPECIES: LysR family transcriptional regulator [unclassified Rhizobium]|uniref:LysR family transcriptional regulator n=1 Tax=unclassified Rhizobium TaxID=2613769 RepID=UPI00177B7310|nr:MULTISPECIES: LysR family transcriptional regulator [unclassified Rhizobium]MBD8688366.1 LysR family transcriptional regulator [Rhizobium sp. CFBP 13644]MBD8692821.1 LysR family transcriptional regulator [Rhizobium sp. CFBP 13717]
MQEKRIDLNLMNVLYAVLAEGSVTRAANRLSLTQPAVSNALGRLRHIMQDELFIKVPGGIEPTAKALEIWPDLQAAMDKIREIAVPQAFSPAQTSLTFNVALTETLISRILPDFTARFLKEAPQAKLHFHVHSNPSSINGLERGVLDCAVGMFPTLDAELAVEPLFTDQYVCIFRHDHPDLVAPVSKEAFLGAKHVLVKQATGQMGIVDKWLEQTGGARDISLVVNKAEEAIEIVRRSDLAAAVPLSFVQSYRNGQDLTVSPLPFVTHDIIYKMAWHKRTERDPARSWLRRVLRETTLNV